MKLTQKNKQEERLFLRTTMSKSALIPTLIDQSVFLPEENNEPIKVNIARAPAVPLGSSVSPLQFSNVVRDL